MVNGKRTNQLFNLKKDPWEVTNLYQQAEHQALIATMEQEMQAQLTTFGDKALLTADNWDIEVLPRWIHKVSAQTIEWLRGLAERERKLRGF